MAKAKKGVEAPPAPVDLVADENTPESPVTGDEPEANEPPADEQPAPKPKSANLPEQVKLARPYGFFDERDVQYYWHAGTVVTDPKQIAVLIERGAPLE